MLIYDPGYDIYHTTFRLIKIIELANGKIEKERLKYLNFIVLFPTQLKNVILPQSYSRIKKKYEENEYNELINSRKVYLQVNTYFDLGLYSLLSYNIVEKEQFTNGIVKASNSFKEILDLLPITPYLFDSDLKLLIKEALLVMSMDEINTRFKYFL